MNITARTCTAVFSDLESEWNQLLENSTSNCIFSTWEWQSTWWESYHPGELWILECRNDSQLIGIAPWFFAGDEINSRIIRSIGCVDVTDYLELIVHQDWVEPVLEGIVDFLLGSKDVYESIDLCNLPANSVTHQIMPSLLESRGFSVSVTQQDVCPIINLSNSWDEYLSGLSKKYRHELRRKLRRSQNAVESIRWYIVGEQNDFESELEYFFQLMRSSHPEKATFLDNTQHRTFFASVARKMFAKGWLQLSFLTIAGRPAATYLNFDYNRQILVYNSGILPDEYGHLSPGIVLLAHLINHAIDTDHVIFDFLRGNESYKYRLGGQDNSVYMLNAELVTD